MRLLTVAIEAVRYLWCIRIRRSFPWGLLPIPPREYIAWRLHTAYGPHTLREVVRLVGARALIRDICGFLLWRREMRLLQRGS